MDYLREILQADDDLLFLLEKRIVDALKKGDVETARRKNRQYNALKEEQLVVMKEVRV